MSINAIVGLNEYLRGKINADSIAVPTVADQYDQFFPGIMGPDDKNIFILYTVTPIFGGDLYKLKMDRVVYRIYNPFFIRAHRAAELMLQYCNVHDIEATDLSVAGFRFQDLQARVISTDHGFFEDGQEFYRYYVDVETMYIEL
jgi:hypothetical protein